MYLIDINIHNVFNTLLFDLSILPVFYSFLIADDSVIFRELHKPAAGMKPDIPSSVNPQLIDLVQNSTHDKQGTGRCSHHWKEEHYIIMNTIKKQHFSYISPILKKVSF